MKKPAGCDTERARPDAIHDMRNLVTTNKQVNIEDAIARKAAESTFYRIGTERKIAAAGCANPIALKNSLADNELAADNFEDSHARYLVAAAMIAPKFSPNALGRFAAAGLRKNDIDDTGVVSLAESFCTQCRPCKLAEVVLSIECAKLAATINRQLSAAHHLRQVFADLEAAA